ncbi:superoxide dismutase family protein [Gordonia sp. PDNC005]|uniref:superoxide dismutase family protein n=1 Tax=unclassified Gordonia (in: high G+C Gram-positive bacteria) TaxID=2657482 RepID=UPI0019646D0E|nr:superoxide dismutase family protein [Gordonia sp. PDNC005]QRY62800.1 superoxide dismutase family protein [Gordonia sp. PDNC005]
MFARNLTGISTTRVLAVVAAAGAAGAVLAGCSPDEHPSDVPGTRPAVITGDQVQPGDDVNAGVQRSNSDAATVTIVNIAGNNVGSATFTTEDDAVTFNIRLSGLEAGEHGVHIHSVGKCEASTKFASAGDHLQVGGHTGKPESGDLGSITVLKNGTGTLSKSTDAFKVNDIRGKAIVVHKVGDSDGTQREACGVIAGRA